MCSDLPLLVRLGYCLYLTGCYPVSPPPLSHPYFWLVAPFVRSESPDWLHVFSFNHFPSEESCLRFIHSFLVLCCFPSLPCFINSSWDLIIFHHSVVPLSSELSLLLSMLHWMQWLCCRLGKNTPGCSFKFSLTVNWVRQRLPTEDTFYYFSFC